ncbi:MAG: hypothetical protein EBX41_09560, partial [Chitinophagia bacterium]|nr:hypothetical protein [Chitinophagia bacterium]
GADLLEQKFGTGEETNTDQRSSLALNSKAQYGSVRALGAGSRNPQFVHVSETTHSKDPLQNKKELDAQLLRLKRMFMLKIAIAILVVVAAAAVITALYAPGHMPDVIAGVVKGLSHTAHDAIFGTAIGVGSVAVLSMFYTSKNFSFYREKLQYEMAGVDACHDRQTNLLDV